MIKNKEIIKTRERVLELAKDIDYGIIPPPMDAQVALNELCRHLLGEDWYTVSPMSREQANTEIVYDIEMKYKDVNNKNKFRSLLKKLLLYLAGRI